MFPDRDLQIVIGGGGFEFSPGEPNYDVGGEPAARVRELGRDRLAAHAWRIEITGERQTHDDLVFVALLPAATPSLPDADLGIVAGADPAESRHAFTTRRGQRHAINRRAPGPAEVTALGWLHPHEARFVRALLAMGGTLVAGVAKRGDAYGWVVYELTLRLPAAFPLDTLALDKLLLYGSIGRDNTGSFYLGGARVGRSGRSAVGRAAARVTRRGRSRDNMEGSDRLLRAYAARGYKRVSGWLAADTISQLIEIDRVQRALGVCGHVGEIGVHHGKLFVLLYLLARPEESAVAVDVFERQDLNRDESGRGSLEILKGHLAMYAGGESKLRVVTADSTTLGADEIRAAAGGPLRLFSVDGGHLADIVRHDLNTTAAAIGPGGVVIVDDYFNPEFPGVSEGTNRFFALDDTRGLVPFLVAPTKLYLTTRSHAAAYLDHFTRLELGLAYEASGKFRVYDVSGSPLRITEMFGADVLSFSPDRYGFTHRAKRSIGGWRTGLRKRLSDSAAWRRMRGTRLAGFVRRLADRLIPY